ncbi:MAG: hypothetical protein V1652_01320 [bacterium]
MRFFFIELIEKITRLLQKSYIRIAFLTFFVSLISFFIGYIAGRDWHTHPIVITPCAAHATMEENIKK